MTSSRSIFQVTSNAPVNDGRWHNVALVVDGVAQTATLYLDGQLVGSASGSFQSIPGSFNQIGTGYTDWLAGDTRGWYGFVGRIDDVRIWSVARTAEQIGHDMTTGPSGTEPGLKAYYPFDEGQGRTAHDMTPNHRDGTLAVSDLPTWVSGRPSTSAATGSLQFHLSPPGTEQLQNSPIIVTTAAGRIQGWLGGSTPDTTYRIDVFASAALRPGGAGEAEDYLGSLEVTTDSQGQAFFDVPFTPPAGHTRRHRHGHRSPGQYLGGLGPAAGRLQAPATVHSPGPRSAGRSSRPRPAMASPCRTRMPGRSTRPGT